MTFISKQDAISLYPALTLELSNESIESNILRFPGATEHQKEAAILAEKICKWHHIYILEFCPHIRPLLSFDVSVQKQITVVEWHESCQNWTKEHQTRIEVLAQSWAEEISNSGIADRLYEPLQRSNSGLIISAHDHESLCNA